MTTEQTKSRRFRPGNILRIIISVVYLLIIIFFAQSRIFLLLGFYHLAFSFTWFILIWTGKVDEIRHPWSWYFPATMDIFCNSLFLIIFGNIHSYIITGYFIITAFASTGTRRAPGIYTIVLSSTIFLAVGFLVLAGILPDKNVLSPTAAPASLPAIVLSYIYLMTGLFAVHGIIRRFYVKSSEMKSRLLSEKKRADGLLKNFLPAKVAEEILARGISKPSYYDSITIMCTCFSGFTLKSREQNPDGLVDELDRIFLQFDNICGNYNVQKIRTLGDTYVCVAGVPEPGPMHVIDMCLAALEIRWFMSIDRAIKENTFGDYLWDIRIDLFTGPAIAGVVGTGTEKFSYNIWGDTMSLASAHEMFGLPGSIAISEKTYRTARYFFSCSNMRRVHTREHGFMNFYSLDGIRKPLRKGDDGITPNKKFLELYRLLQQGKTLKFRSEV